MCISKLYLHTQKPLSKIHTYIHKHTPLLRISIFYPSSSFFFLLTNHQSPVSTTTQHKSHLNPQPLMAKCEEHCKSEWPKRLRKAAKYGGVALFILLVIVLLTWAILQPHDPRFVLQDTTLYGFNVSSNPNLLTTTFQVTIAAYNRNKKIGIYYDKLEVYATYRDQQITLRTGIPKSYAGHRDIDIWSPFLSGNQVPVAPYNAMSLAQDQAIGYVLVEIKIDGKLRWRVGSFSTGAYHIFVKCPARIPVRNGNTGVLVENRGIKYQLMQRCSVSV